MIVGPRPTSPVPSFVTVIGQWNADEAEDADERGGSALQGLTRGLSRATPSDFSPSGFPAFPRAAGLSTMALQDFLGLSVLFCEFRLVRVPCLGLTTAASRRLAERGSGWYLFGIRKNPLSREKRGGNRDAPPTALSGPVVHLVAHDREFRCVVGDGRRGGDPEWLV